MTVLMPDRTIRAVFFDIDGTLVDSNEFHVTAWHEAFESAGIHLEREVIRKEIGKGADMLIPSLAPGVDTQTYDAISKKHRELFQSRYLEKVEPLPCGRDLIATLHRQGIKVVLASSAEATEIQHYVDLLRIGDFLNATVSADDVKHSKPAPDVFAKALCKVMPVTAHDAIAIGDTPWDIIAAGRCDIDTIAVRSGGFADSELNGTGAIAVFDSVEDIFRANGLQS
jgi:HAD superfamily hydrolase (TIGR01509 family)